MAESFQVEVAVQVLLSHGQQCPQIVRTLHGGVDTVLTIVLGIAGTNSYGRYLRARFAGYMYEVYIFGLERLTQTLW